MQKNMRYAGFGKKIRSHVRSHIHIKPASLVIANITFFVPSYRMFFFSWNC